MITLLVLLVLALIISILYRGVQVHREPGGGGFCDGYTYAKKCFKVTEQPPHLMAQDLLDTVDEAQLCGNYTNFDRGIKAYISDNHSWIYKNADCPE